MMSFDAEHARSAQLRSSGTPAERQHRSPVRRALFVVAKSVGLFALARWLYRNRQCILGYHAFSVEDEERFRPQLYMQPRRFASRLDLLMRRGYRVIPLGEAARRLRSGTCSLRDVAITIDDGFTSVHRFAAIQLRDRKMPATLFLTTYYVDRPYPVFELALQYVLWKSNLDWGDLELERFGIPMPGTQSLRGQGGTTTVEHIVEIAGETLDDAGRQALLAHIAGRVSVSLDALVADRRFHLVTPEMAAELQAHGIELQLHTHRHRFPEDAWLLAREIDDNRRALARLGAGAAVHLCYPSGEWRESAFEVLSSHGVETASTCVAGLNHGQTPLLALTRFLDADDIPEIEFEAEISGFKQLLRDTRAALAI